MKLEDARRAVGLANQIARLQAEIKEIEDQPVARLILERVHGRSVAVSLDGKAQAVLAIKQFLIVGMKEEIQQAEKEMNHILLPST